MWLGLSGKLIQEGIYTPLITPSPTMSWTKIWITLNTTPVPKINTTLRTYLIPAECFTQITLLHIVADDAKDGYQFGNIVLVFVDWAIIGAPNSKKFKVRAYLCIIDSGAYKQHQAIQASDGNDGDMFGWSVAVFGKTVFVRATWKNNENGLDEGAVYAFTGEHTFDCN